MSRDQKWVQTEKEYTPSESTSDTKILTTGGSGGVLLVRKGNVKNSNF